MDRTEVMSFLFQLGNMTLGRAYDLSALTETQRIFIEDLVDFGLVYRSSKVRRRLFPFLPYLASQRKARQKSPCFYPTRLATTLISGIMAGQQSEQEGFIVVETNYRVYAYTGATICSLHNAVHGRLTGLFCRLAASNSHSESILHSQLSVCQYGGWRHSA